MSSSDSEDCYGNIAQKLQSLKNRYVEDKLPPPETFLNVAVVNTEISNKTDVNTVVIDEEEFNATLNSTDDNEECTLDAIIAKNSKPVRGRKRKSADPCTTISTRKSTRRTKANSNKSANDEVSEPTAAKRGRSRRVRASENAVINATATEENSPGPTSLRGRSRRSRGSTPSCSRGRGRGRNRRNTSRYWMQQVITGPVYSVGNTDEYPDMCDSQELFSTNKSTNKEVEIVEEEDPLANENEELSVKVYWQSLEVVRFKIRRYQKLAPIFKYFSEKENVDIDKLLLMYNDKILKVEDTPEAIDYSIAKFIEGGIVGQKITSLIKQDNKVLKDGLQIKFQCQNVKKPFETTIRPEDKLASAMMKCAEHLETPLEKVKFYFDGDLITSKNTAQELDLEGGECIDVKICS